MKAILLGGAYFNLFLGCITSLFSDNEAAAAYQVACACFLFLLYISDKLDERK